MSAPESAPNSDQSLIDIILYLASLVSDPKVIDPIMDEVRQVTANMQPGVPLDPAARQKLEHVRQEITDHLLHRDLLRTFAPDELQQKLVERFGSDGKTPKARQTLRQIILIFLATAAYTLVSLPIRAVLPPAQGMLITPFLAMVGLFLGIGWLFWSGLRDFIPKVRRAYGLIAAGFILTGLGGLPAPLAAIFPDNVLFRYSVIMPLFVPANLCIYFGTQMFAQIVGIKSKLVSRAAVLGVAVVAALAVIPLPHPSREPSEAFFDATMAAIMIIIVLAGSSALLALQIAHHTTAMYTKAMAWFSATMAMVAIPFVLEAVLIFCLGRFTGVLLLAVLAIFSAGGFLMIMSAYTFKRSSGST
jgi:hypothetical protein